MKILPNIDDDERDRVFNTAVEIVGLCGALITWTWPRVVARIPFNMLFNLGRVTGSVRARSFFLQYYSRQHTVSKAHVSSTILRSFGGYRESIDIPILFSISCKPLSGFRNKKYIVEVRGE